MRTKQFLEPKCACPEGTCYVISRCVLCMRIDRRGGVEASFWWGASGMMRFVTTAVRVTGWWRFTGLGLLSGVGQKTDFASGSRSNTRMFLWMLESICLSYMSRLCIVFFPIILLYLPDNKQIIIPSVNRLLRGCKTFQGTQWRTWGYVDGTREVISLRITSTSPASSSGKDGLKIVSKPVPASLLDGEASLSTTLCSNSTWEVGGNGGVRSCKIWEFDD